VNISSLGEFELIARLTSNLKERSDVKRGVGDDCAVLDIGGDRLLLATCDSLVEGSHFTFHLASPEQIGRKALAVNLSDIAAMGGEPRFALVSLILPSQLSLAVLDSVYAGIQQEAQRYSTMVVGGNIAGTGRSEQLVIDITLLGVVEHGRALLRSGARVGDLLCITGSPGDAAAGLHTLLHPALPYPQEALEYVRSCLRAPQPRVAEGRVLGQLGPEAVTAALDVSDGLSGDLGHLCECSNVGAAISLNQLPLSSAMRAIAIDAKKNPLDWALHGGEDYELLFTVSPARVQDVVRAVPEATGTPVTVIGRMVPPEEGMVLLHPDGHTEPLRIKSWDHLRQ
jgi:thiamine-monophosphate kinase